MVCHGRTDAFLILGSPLPTRITIRIEATINQSLLAMRSYVPIFYGMSWKQFEVVLGFEIAHRWTNQCFIPPGQVWPSINRPIGKKENFVGFCEIRTKSLDFGSTQ